MAFFTILTSIGQAKIANAVALGQQIQLTEMALGDGNGNPTTPNQSQTNLVRQVYRAQLNQLSTDPANPNYVIAELVVRS
ncbi:phage tail protein, partial [Bifidobacterium adolescentis]|uniref:phage tail protein n=1 Tax=Bifidobacterium adolescentis TaxID=1680 RepID=UPI00223BB035